MSTTYENADNEIVEMVDLVKVQWHFALHTAGVKIGVIMALNEDGPAVKHGGYPAAATIKVVGAKDRIKKKYDAELMIDHHVWMDYGHNERMALLDHELSHLALVPNKPKKGEEDNGSPWKFDDHGRPKLKTVKGDWNGGDGFISVVERHGEAAFELMNARTCYDKAKSALPEVNVRLAQ